MPTPPPDLPAGDSHTASTPTHRFRAATFDEAVALAHAEFGDQVEVVEANRIRRGGIGGFFATDLGVEVVIRPAAAPAEPARDEVDPGESAIDRLLALVDAQERAAREPAVADRTDFAAALAHELRAPSPAPMTSADWSVEAYRRLAIPAAPRPVSPAIEPATAAEPVASHRSAAAPVAEDDPPDRTAAPARPNGPRSRRHASRNLAARLEYAARAAAEPVDEPDAAVLPFVTGAPAVAPEPPAPVAAATEFVEPSAAALGIAPVATAAAATAGAVTARDVAEVVETVEISRVAPAAATAVASAGEPAGAARPVNGDAATQTMDLVTQAATALFSQLGTMPVVAGSQAANVRKLTVSVTSPLGKVIEISAELGDQGAS